MKRLIGVILLLGMLGCSMAFSESPSQKFLHCRGMEIVDEGEKPVLLRGVGLGGWLVPEGYMLHTPQQSPTGIRQAIEKLIGARRTEEFYRRYEDNYYTEADIRAIASWGLNSIRLPFHANIFWNFQTNAFREEGFERTDQLLAWCKKYDLYLILDMHCAFGGQNSQNISDSDGQARLWTEAGKYQPPTVEVWRRIAEKYRNETRIAGYDLLNEPVLPVGYNNKKLRELYIQITRAIREVDPNHIIFVEGNDWATDFRELVPPWDGNMAYSFHKYWNENSFGSIRNYLEVRKSAQAPLWMGESGENSNHWFNACIKLLEENNIGWSWWAPKKFNNTTNPYMATIPQKFHRIVDYWNRRASKPAAPEAETILFEMAENLALSKCRYFPDVVAAITGKDFELVSQPYVKNRAPGEIRCVDYNLGSDGAAYHDGYSQLTTGLQNFHNWNEGGYYRNDGVDIGRNTGSPEPEYYVGWTEPGEWLEYTVDFSKDSGDYAIVLQITKGTMGGKFRFFLDGQPLSVVIGIPKSRSREWENVPVGKFKITKGIHRLRLYIQNGGFNISRIIIE